MCVNVLLIFIAWATSSAETSDRLLPPCWQLYSSNGNNTDNKGAAYQENVRHTRKLAVRQCIEHLLHAVIAESRATQINLLAIVRDALGGNCEMLLDALTDRSSNLRCRVTNTRL